MRRQRRRLDGRRLLRRAYGHPGRPQRRDRRRPPRRPRTGRGPRRSTCKRCGNCGWSSRRMPGWSATAERSCSLRTWAVIGAGRRRLFPATRRRCSTWPRWPFAARSAGSPARRAAACCTRPMAAAPGASSPLPPGCRFRAMTFVDDRAWLGGRRDGRDPCHRGRRADLATPAAAAARGPPCWDCSATKTAFRWNWWRGWPADEGYLSVIDVLGRRDLEVAARDEAHRDGSHPRGHAAVGGCGAETAWQFPLRQAGPAAFHRGGHRRLGPVPRRPRITGVGSRIWCGRSASGGRKSS